MVMGAGARGKRTGVAAAVDDALFRLADQFGAGNSPYGRRARRGVDGVSDVETSCANAWGRRPTCGVDEGMYWVGR